MISNILKTKEDKPADEAEKLCPHGQDIDFNNSFLKYETTVHIKVLIFHNKSYAIKQILIIKIFSSAKLLMSS